MSDKCGVHIVFHLILPKLLFHTKILSYDHQHGIKDMATADTCIQTDKRVWSVGGTITDNLQNSYRKEEGENKREERRLVKHQRSVVTLDYGKKYIIVRGDTKHDEAVSFDLKIRNIFRKNSDS
ncbi:hypothetical protein LOAG_12365 [Loa loa]|uniref:Uncharacterized protein n=1 Tax=Loa loa TaxID=7209 RepID=A0A1S0TLD8_LOALO|nr:hypothetical protein LOAG_12365 [Loa loa]EFO16142.1 hypothetical protein LOAG_12365 [Loa loa]